MYCSSCGGAVTRGLSYCNHCGSKLSAAKSSDGTKQSNAFHESLVWAIVSVFVGGVGVTIGLMAVMKEVGFNTGVVLAVTLLSFLVMLVVESVLIWMLVRQQIGVKATGEAKRTSERATQEISSTNAHLLPEPATSITEHTTRTFDPVYIERKSK